MKKVLEEQLKSIDDFLKSYDMESLFMGIDALQENTISFVDPLFVTEATFREVWESEEYQGKGFAEDAPEFYSEKGERVRSKSEKMIADKLLLMDVPYKYERPLYLNGYGWIYPDFTLYNVQTREDIYLEHYGRLDDFDYIQKALLKTRSYERNGYFLGEKLFITGETSLHPFDMKMFDQMIRRAIGTEW